MRAVQRAAGTTPRRSPAFGRLPGRPFAPAQQRAAARTRRAQSRIPSRPLPYVPIIRNPTPAQVLAATRVIARTVTRAAGSGGSGRERLARRDAIVRELGQTAEGRRFLRAGQHYAREQSKLLSRSGTLARNALDRVAPGVPHTRIGPGFASIDTTALGHALLGATSLEKAGGSPGANRFLRNALSDIGGLGTLPFVGGYQLGAAAYEASPIRDALGGRSDTSRALRLGKGALKGIEQSVPAALLTGHPRLALKRFGQHPVYGLLDTAGGLSAVGRTLGAGARAAGSTAGASGVRGGLARAGSTVRAPVALTEDIAGGHVQRTYSKDLLRKGVQVLSDRSRPKLTRDGKPVTVSDRGREVPVLKPRTELGRRHLANRVGNLESGTYHASEKLARERAVHESTTPGRAGAVVHNTRSKVTGEPTVSGVRGRHERDIVAVAVQGGITSTKHFVADLGRYVDRLDREYRVRSADKSWRHTEEARANRANARTARKVLASPRLRKDAPAIIAEAQRVGRLHRKADLEKARLRIGEPERYRRAALEVPAIEHMGARHFTVEEHAKLEREALVHEHRLRDELFGVKDGKRGRIPDGQERARLQREYDRARAHRIAVSGKAPGKVLAHEEARAAHERAHADYQKADKKVKAAERARDELLGSQATKRGQRQQAARRGDSVSGVATKSEKAALEKAAQAVTEARRERAAVRAKRTKAQRTLRRTPEPKANAGIRYGEESAKALGRDELAAGTHLPNEDIERFLRQRGRDPETVAYLPHRGDVVGSRAYHAQLRMGTRPTEKPEARTGEAYRKGSTRMTADLIRDQGARQAVQINKARYVDRMVGKYVMRHPAWTKAQRGETLTASEKRVADAGGGFTAKEAVEVAQRALADNGEYLVPVRMHPALSADTRAVIRENLQGPGGMESLGQRLLNDRVVTEADVAGKQTRNVGLMSGHLFDRLNDHLKPSGPLLRAAQVLNRAFRYAVLPQPRWLTGNFMEPYIVRLTVHGSGVNVFGLGLDIAKSKSFLKQLRKSGDPRVREAAQQLEAAGLGGLFIGNRGLTIRRGMSDFPTLDRTLKGAYGRMVSKLPAVETFGDITHTLLRGGARAVLAPLKAFFSINRGIERGAQHATIGHLLRDDLQQFTGSWFQTLKTGEKAWREAKKGLVDTPTQHRWLTQAHEILGQYDSWSPMMRAIVQGPAPFLPWMLNAARFVYCTKPAHHTVATAFLTKVAQVVQDDWKTLHANTPPGALRDAIPNGRGGWVDLARYTPYAATIGPVEGEGLRGLKSQFFPQVGGTSAAIGGKDPFGRELQVPKTAKNPSGKATAGQELGIGANSLAEALVPYLAYARRLQEHGGTSYSNSTVFSPKVKPNTSHMSALRRTFDPFRPTYLKQPAGNVAVRALSGKTAGLDEQDLRDLRQAVGGAGVGLDKADLEELRQLARGGG